MSGAGRPAADAVDATGLTLAIAATRWHAEITDAPNPPVVHFRPARRATRLGALPRR